MKSRKNSLFKAIILAITALFTQQAINAWGVNASLFHNESTGHTVALLGDRHADSNTDDAEPLFETITKPHFERLLTQDNTYHFIVEGELDADVEPEDFENEPLFLKFRYKSHYPHNNFMNIPITTQVTLNDERSGILTDVLDTYWTAINDNLELLCEYWITKITLTGKITPSLKDITQEYAVLVTLEPEDRIRYLLENSELQQWLLNYHGIDVKKEIIQFFTGAQDANYFSAQEILDELDYFSNQASDLALCENQQHKKLWEFYSTKLNEGCDAAKKCFQILDENDLIKDGAWNNAIVNDMFTRKSVKTSWIDPLILDTLPEFGFMVKIIEDIALHKKTFLYSGSAHSIALKPQLESIGYTCVLEFICPYEQTLTQTEYDQFFTQFFA